MEYDGECFDMPEDNEADMAAIVERAYREGFQDGFDHGNLSYKYPGVDQAWDKSCVKEELDQ